MSRLLALPMLALVLVACPPAQPPDTINTKSNVKVLSKDQINAATTDQLELSTSDVATGDVVVSDFQDTDDDGVLRKITNVSTTTVGIGPQAITKVYVKTEAATLEDVFDTGEGNINFGGLSFDQATTQTVQGVRAEAVTGTIDIKNVTIPLPGNVGNVSFNGALQQSLEPTFKLIFDKGKISQFEIGLSGTISATLKAKLSANAKFTGVGISQTIASTTIRRLFLISGIPVVVVIEPKVVLGLTGGASDNVTVEAGINPTLSGGFKVAYNAKNTTKWTTTWTPPTFNLNPSFSYSVPTTGTGEAYGKLVMDIKFYGLAGPTVETKPYLGLNLNPNGTATTKAGMAASGSLKAGISVLGKSIQLATDPLTQDASATYTCTASSGACK
jgi:hypothetical protein